MTTSNINTEARSMTAKKTRQVVSTPNAPGAIGAYSQAVKCGPTVYLSGQIPLDPVTMEIVSDDPREQVAQVFKNLKAVCEAAGGSFDNIVRLKHQLLLVQDKVHQIVQP